MLLLRNNHRADRCGRSLEATRSSKMDGSRVRSARAPRFAVSPAQQRRTSRRASPTSSRVYQPALPRSVNLARRRAHRSSPHRHRIHGVVTENRNGPSESRRGRNPTTAGAPVRITCETARFPSDRERWSARSSGRAGTDYGVLRDRHRPGTSVDAKRSGTEMPCAVMAAPASTIRASPS